MPFFRCNGASIYSLALKEVYSKVIEIFNNNVDIHATFTMKHQYGSYGIVGDGTSLEVDSLSGFDQLRKLLEYFGYDVSIPYSQGSSIILYYKHTNPDDSDKPGYPGTNSCSKDIYFFTASMPSANKYLSNYSKKLREAAVNVFGNTFSIGWHVNGYQQSYNRHHEFTSVSDWASKLKTAFTQAGYRNTAVNGTVSGAYYWNASGDGQKTENINVIKATLS